MNIVKKNFFFISFFSFLLVANTHAESAFQRDLTVGMEGEDVMFLQQVLNKDPDTALSTPGPGSLGFETIYFGEKTKAAVIKFQNKYAADILSPLGYLYGSGYFGPRTREKINSILEGRVVSTPSLPPITSPDLSGLEKAYPKNTILPVSQSSLTSQIGQSFYIFGIGFEEKNTITVGTKDATSKFIPPYTLEVTVPSLEEGVYSVHIKNSKGESVKMSDRNISVGSATSIPPKINKVTVTGKGKTADLHIEGDNFSDKNNAVYTPFGSELEVKSNQGVIIFSLQDLPQSESIHWEDAKGKISFPLSVGSGGGVSNQFIVNMEL